MINIDFNSLDAIIKRAIDALIAHQRDMTIDSLILMIDDFDNIDCAITHALIDIIDNALHFINRDIDAYRDYMINARALIDA